MAKKVEKINVLAIKDAEGKIVGFILKNGVAVEVYTCTTAGMDDIEELLKSSIM